MYLLETSATAIAFRSNVWQAMVKMVCGQAEAEGQSEHRAHCQLKRLACRGYSGSQDAAQESAGPSVGTADTQQLRKPVVLEGLAEVARDRYLRTFLTLQNGWDPRALSAWSLGNSARWPQ